MKKNYLLSMVILFGVTMCHAQTWTLQNSTTTENINSVNFRLSYQNTMAGWAVGDNNTGLSTQDGGNNWYTSLVTNQNNYCVYFTRVDFGHVVGSNSFLWYTDAGGLWWYPHGSSASPNYYSVWFAYRDTGFTVGENGVILKTIDEGNNWVLNSSGTTSNLRSVTGIDINNLWVAGDNGTITHTSNGGTNWDLQSSGITRNLHSIDFTSLDSGWACGDSGAILFTSNGGLNWDLQTANTSLNLNGIYFVDTHNGWAVGDSGIIIHTINGGANWNMEISNTYNKLNSVNFYDLDSGWAGGNGGTILRYTKSVASGIQNSSENNFKISISPVPADDKINVTLSNKQLLSYKIINALGESILSGRFGSTGQTIDVSLISKGIYSIILYNDKTVESKLFVKN